MRPFGLCDTFTKNLIRDSVDRNLIKEIFNIGDDEYLLIATKHNYVFNLLNKLFLSQKLIFLRLWSESLEFDNLPSSLCRYAAIYKFDKFYVVFERYIGSCSYCDCGWYSVFNLHDCKEENNISNDDENMILDNSINKLLSMVIIYENDDIKQIQEHILEINDNENGKTIIKCDELNLF